MADRKTIFEVKWKLPVFVFASKNAEIGWAGWNAFEIVCEEAKPTSENVAQREKVARDNVKYYTWPWLTIVDNKKMFSKISDEEKSTDNC